MSNRASHPRFHDLIDITAAPERIGGAFIFTEGPVWHPLEGYLVFSDMPGDKRRRWSAAGGVSEISNETHKANGMTRDREMNLLICEHATSAVTRIAPSGAREVLCSHFEGKELNSPNDIVMRSDGSIWFTDPTYGRMPHFGVPRDVELGFQGVYRLSPWHRAGDEPQLVSERYMFSQPNGLCFSPCERFLYVNDTDQGNIRVFEIAGDGRLTRGRLFATGIYEDARAGRPDGMKSDSEGNIWVTAPGGLWVYGHDGVKLGEIACPEQVANFHWGGADYGTLFLCASTSLYAMKTSARPRREPFMVAGAPAPALPAINPAETALLIQDMQNDPISEGGAFAESGAPGHAKRQNVIENSRRLAAACRRAGIPVIYIWFICEPGHPGVTRHAPLYEGLLDNNALVRGTWGAAPAEGMEPQQGDIVVEKKSMSAWETSDLESRLRSMGVRTLINTGAWTNMSIEHTARTGADKGFRIILPEDACSTMNEDWHRASLDYAMSNVATITSVDEVIAALG